MASRKDHEYDTEKRLGTKATDIHKAMDHMFAQFYHRHRFVYHHKEGIIEIAKRVAYANNMDYDLAVMAAECHVRLDFHLGWQLSIPCKDDYLCGDGDWPTIGEWKGLCPWSTSLSDKHFGVTQEIIDEVHRRLNDE